MSSDSGKSRDLDLGDRDHGGARGQVVRQLRQRVRARRGVDDPPHLVAAREARRDHGPVTQRAALALEGGVGDAALRGLVAVVEQVAGHAHAPNRRSRSALATTLTLENAIAAEAITGFSRPAAASGMAATL